MLTPPTAIDPAVVTSGVSMPLTAMSLEAVIRRVTGSGKRSVYGVEGRKAQVVTARSGCLVAHDH